MGDQSTPLAFGGLPLLLGQKLAAFFAQGFFRLLARASAAVYADCADRLERASDEGGQISHEDALIIIRETLALNPRVELESDEGGDSQDLRVRARSSISCWPPDGSRTGR